MASNVLSEYMRTSSPHPVARKRPGTAVIKFEHTRTSGSRSGMRAAEQHPGPATARTFAEEYPAEPVAEPSTDGIVQGCIKQLTAVDLQSPTMCVDIDSDGLTAAYGCFNGTVKLHKINKRPEKHNMTSLVDQNPSPISDVRHIKLPQQAKESSPSPLLATAHSNGSVAIWDTRDNIVLTRYQDAAKAVFSLAFSQQCRKMATASQDCQVRIYDMESGSRKCSVLGDVFDEDPGVVAPRTDVCMYGSHSSHVYAVKFNPNDDNLLISGGWDRGVRLWDLRTKSHVKTLGACGPIVTGDSLDYKKAGDVILVGSHSRDNCLEEYDVGTGKVISTIKLSVPSQICCCQYMGEDQNVVLCGGKQDNMMRVLSTTGDGGTLARVSNLERSVYSVAHCKPRDHKVTVKRKGGELVTRTERFGFIAMCTDTLVCIYRHEIE